MSSFSRFTEKNKARSGANSSVNSEFIVKGYPSTTIYCGENKKTACVVNKQESGVAYVYTNINDSLNIGSVWVTKTLPLLIAEEIVIIKDVSWKKYKALICNIVEDGLYGWYYGPESKHTSVSLRQEVMITSDIKPVLALQTGLLAVGDKVYIKGRGFLVQEFDEISNPGIGYYSLVATTIGKDDLEKNKDKTFFIIKKKEANINYGNKNNEEIFVSIVPNQATLISTERGYFKSSLNSIKVLSITEREVSFSIPFGVDTFTVTTLKNGREYKTTYKAVK